MWLVFWPLVGGKDSLRQGAPKAREKRRPLVAVSGNINHRVPRSKARG